MNGRGGRRRRAPREAARLLAAALTLVVAVVVTRPAPALAETRLRIGAGYDGWFVPGRSLPVLVHLAADRLVRGSLEVTAGRSTPVTTPVEVPGGSEKRFVVTVPTPPQASLSASSTVRVRLVEGSRPVAAGTTPVRASPDQELVGLLPGVYARTASAFSAPLAVDAGIGRFVALTEEHLRLAPESLGPLSTIGMRGQDLAELPDDTRRGVLAWVASGGTLLVDVPPGTPVTGLPDEWQPAVHGRGAAGAGHVRVTDGAMAAGRWNGLVEPTGWNLAPSASGTGGVSGPLSGALASESGLRVPALRWLVAYLVVYVALVGPIGFFVLRRRHRPELAWVAIPLAALLFTTTSFVAGRNLRRAARLVHATVLSTGPLGSTAATGVGVFSPGGGTNTVGLAPGWTTAEASTGTLGSAARLALVTRTSGGPEARLPLEPGQFGLVTASGPATVEGRLLVTGRSAEEGRATGQVRNTTPFTLEQVAIYAGSGGTVVGTLRPGESRNWTLAEQDNVAFGGLPEFRIWELEANRPDAPVSYGLWEAAKTLGGPDFRAPGAVVAAGWTRQFVPPVRLAHRPSDAPEGRTVVVGRGVVEAHGPTRTGLAVGRELLRGELIGAKELVAAGPLLARFTLPPASPLGDYSLVLRSPASRAEIWTDGDWRPVDCGRCPGAAQPADGQWQGVSDITLPTGAGRDGVVHVRLTDFPGFAEQGIPLTLRSVGS